MLESRVKEFAGREVKCESVVDLVPFLLVVTELAWRHLMGFLSGNSKGVCWCYRGMGE